jgi:hypothetical protein
MLKYWFAWLLFFAFASAIAGKIDSSKVYDKKYHLLADSSFQITKKQYKKFVLIEDSLTKNVLDSSTYDEVYRENRVNYNAVVSFQLDGNGHFNDIKIEKFTSSSNSKIELNVNSRPFKLMITDALKKNNGRYTEFKACKNKTEKYFLAFSFIVGENDEKYLKTGWLFYQRKKVSGSTGQQTIWKD